MLKLVGFISQKPAMEALTLSTERLLLSKPVLADAPRIIQLANDPLIAAYTLSVPYPYTEAAAITWLAAINEGWSSGNAYSFAIREAGEGRMVGAVGLHRSPQYGYGELGYWMGAAYRARGYVKEAVAAVIDFGFEKTSLLRIQAIHWQENPASGSILRANGLQREATLEQYLIKNGAAWDVIQYRILRSEWQQARPSD